VKRLTLDSFVRLGVALAAATFAYNIYVFNGLVNSRPSTPNAVYSVELRNHNQVVYITTEDAARLERMRMQLLVLFILVAVGKITDLFLSRTGRD
jgi:hypothetical protein